MSFPCKLYSHPNKFLIDHLKNVGQLSRTILNEKSLESRELFSHISYLIGVCHDFGKATPAFQKYLDDGERTKYANHGFISSLFGYFVVKEHLRKSSNIDEFWYLPVISWIVINKHHGNIKNIRGDFGEISKLKEPSEIQTLKEQTKSLVTNIDELTEIYTELAGLNISEYLAIDLESLLKNIYQDAKNLCGEDNFSFYFLTLVFYSALLDADKLDAAGRNRLPDRIEKIEDNLIDRYIKDKFDDSQRTIDKMRKMAFDEVTSHVPNLNIKEERIFSLNLPTGVGKTLTGLSFALKLRSKIQKEMNFTPRIIYSLPFLSIIDQNAAVINAVLSQLYPDGSAVPSNLFLKHHHLSDIEFVERRGNEEELDVVKDVNIALLLTESWHSEIIITTFIQFFHSIITNKNRAAKKYHNCINSIIILDEIQSVPHCYWVLINRVLTYLGNHYNCWIILMTATQPLIFKPAEINSLIKDRSKYFESLDRVTFNFDLDKKGINQFKEELLTQIMQEEKKDILVVLNTINSCKDVYNFLKNELSIKYHQNPENCIDDDGICQLPNQTLINLSTHIFPDSRLKRINRIKQRTKNQKIIISTQMIEAGVDISVDIIFRDFAPLDSLIQTAGRCNRNNENQKGIVNIVYLIDEKRNKPFCTIYDSTLLDITKNVIREFGNTISESAFTTKAADKYYSLVVNRGTDQLSMKLVEDISKLNFEEISSFHLIEENISPVTVFIELDEKAEGIRKSMVEVLIEKKNFERKTELLKLRKDINQYCLSLRVGKNSIDMIKRELPGVGNIDDFRYVPREKIKDWYKRDTGFNVPEDGAWMI